MMNEKNKENLFKFVKNYYHVYEYENKTPIELSRNICIPIEFDGLPQNVSIEEGTVVRDPRYPTWTLKQEELTEDSYVKNYGNPFASIIHRRSTLVVEKCESKVSMKVFTYIRHRREGRVFFKTTTDFKFITYNLDTNNLYHGSIKNYHKKRKSTKKIKMNCFETDPFGTLMSTISSLFLNEAIGNTSDNKLVYDSIKIFMSQIPGTEKYKNEKVTNILYRIYCENKGIKIPNNWSIFTQIHPQPRLKTLRKHNMKYIDCLMGNLKISGDKLKKVFHSLEKFGGVNFYLWCENFFGKSFMIGQSVEVLSKIFEHFNSPSFSEDLQNFSKFEKKKIYKIVELVAYQKVDMSVFSDHFHMINKLSNFEPVKWKSSNYDDFMSEHIEYTEKLSYYTNGEYSRKYPETFINFIEEKLDGEYYPVVLKNSKEYISESATQSNCVKGYVTRAISLIISLRRGSVDSKERATIEFHLYTKQGKFQMTRVQTLGRFNNRLDSSWDNVLLSLDQKVQKVVTDKLFDGIFVSTYKVSNKEVTTKTHFEGNPFDEQIKNLDWEDPNFSDLSFSHMVPGLWIPQPLHVDLDIEPVDMTPYI